MPVKVECESCKAPYTIDERRIPASGLRVRCPKCAKTFVIKKPSDAASAAPPATSPATSAATSAATPAAAPKPAAAKAGLPAPEETDLPASPDVGLPATVARDLPARRPAGTIAFAGAPAMGAPTANKPASPAQPKTVADLPASRAAAPASPIRAPQPAADLPAKKAAAAPPADLPATRANPPTTRAFDLPAPRASQAKPPAAPPPRAAAPTAPTAPTGAAAPTPPTAPAGDDLPMVRAGTNAGAKAAPKPFTKGTQLGLGQFAPKGATAGNAPTAKDDLPATRDGKAGDVALPATKGAAGARPTRGGDAFADLPASTEKRVDLPSPKRGADLPAVRGGGGLGVVDLPTVSAKADLPATKGGFGELDLPDMQTAALPVPAGNVGLPVPSSGVGLPSPAGASALPAVQQTGRGSVDLPTVASAAAHLPAVPAPEGKRPVGENDPFADFGAGPDPFAHASADAGVAQTMQRPDVESSGGFGELELPGPSAAGQEDLGLRSDASRGFDDLQLEAPAPSRPRTPTHDDGGFGDLDIPAPNAFGASPSATMPKDAPIVPIAGGPPSSKQDRAGGMGFGEVELPGGGGDDDMEFGAIPQAEAPVGSPQTADIPAETSHEYEAPIPKPRDRDVGAGAQPEKKKSSKVGWVVLGLFAAAVIAGGALETTKHGAFFRNDIVDKMNAENFVSITTTAVKRTRDAFADDTAPSAAAAIAQLDADVQRAPRHAPLLAYAAYANFADEIRFGKDAALDSKGQRLLAQAAVATPYKRLAEGARDVVAGQYAGARSSLSSLLTGDTALDAAVTLGELELRDKKPKAAVDAFTQAKKAQDSARTRNGLMRAYDANGDVEAAKKEATELATKYPKAVPARLLLAHYAWEKNKDEKETLKWLDELKKPEVAANAAPSELIDAATLRGDVLLDRGHVSEARVAYEQAIKDSHGTPAPLAELGLGEVDMASGQYATAIAHFNAASQAQPDLTSARIGLARAKLKQELPAEAKAVLQPLHDPKRAGEIGFWLGQAEEKLEPDKPAEAMKIYQDAIKAQPSEVKAYIALAKLQAKSGNTDDADATLQQALKAVPASDKLYLGVGQLRYQQGKYDDALAQFEQALKLQPENLEALFEKGRTLLRMQKRMDDGKAVLDEVEKKDPKYPGLALEFGYYYLHTNQVAEALKRYQSALDAAPNDADVKLNVGIAMVESGNPDAEQTLRDVLDKCASQSASPDSCTLEAKHYLGRALLLKNTPADAIVFLKQAVEKGDANTNYHLYYGWALFEMGRYDDADQEINRTLELDKSKAEAYWLRGEIYSRRSQFKDSIAAANQALKLNTNLFAAYATIAYSQHELGNDGEAIADYKKAIEGDATNSHAPWWRYQIADIAYHSGNVASAVGYLKDAIDAATKETPSPPWLPKAFFYLGEALRHSDKAEAIKAYQSFLSRTVGSTDPARGDAKAALVELGSPYGGQ